MNTSQNYKGFNKGFEQIPKRFESELRQKLKEILNISPKNRASLINYKKGKVFVKADKIHQIENIFLNYGITEIWGE